MSSFHVGVVRSYCRTIVWHSLVVYSNRKWTKHEIPKLTGENDCSKMIIVKAWDTKKLTWENDNGYENLLIIDYQFPHL